MNAFNNELLNKRFTIDTKQISQTLQHSKLQQQKKHFKKP